MFIETTNKPYDKAVTIEIYPYMKWIQICMVFGYLILALISIKRPKLAKAFIYYECLYQMVEKTLPVDHYDSYASEFFFQVNDFTNCLQFNYLISLLPVIAMWIYLDLIAPRIIYE